MEIPYKTKTWGTISSSRTISGAYVQRKLIQKYTYTPVFIAALFRIAKTWKYAWRSVDKEAMVYILNIPQTLKEWNNDICSNMDEPRDYHTKLSKLDKDKYHVILPLYVELKK